MAEVVVLNGPPGVGKSTVAAVLRAFVPGTVAISGDALRDFAPPNARAHLGGGATYRVGGALATSYLELGAERVIFDYVFLRPSHFRYFREALPVAVRAHVFTLWAPLEMVAAREAQRADGDRLGLAVRDCYLEMAENMAQMGEILDATGLDPAPLAQRIHELTANASRH